MAGTVTISRIPKASPYGRPIEKVKVEWTSDASGNADSIIQLYGFLVKAITKPTDSPTDNYDVQLGDPDDSALDALGGALDNRDTANTEQAYPAVTNAAVPILLAGAYTFKVANAGNAKSGTVWFYLVESF